LSLTGTVSTTVLAGICGCDIDSDIFKYFVGGNVTTETMDVVAK
jgi:hypothetical protein